MSTAAILAILVAAGETQSPATINLCATIEQALGTGTSIHVREASRPTEAEALKVERDLGADVVVTLVWQEPAHLHAVLRVHVARTNRWTSETIGFSAWDSLTERGRTLGLAVASMWPETMTVAGARASPGQESPRPSPGVLPSPSPPPPLPRVVPTPAAAPPPRAVVRTPPPAPAPASPPAAPSLSRFAPPRPLPTPSTEPSTPAAAPPPPLILPPPVRSSEDQPPPGRAPRPTASVRSPSTVSAKPRARSSVRPFWIGLSAVGAVGVGGPASGLGGGAEAGRRLPGNLALRLGASLRVGPLPQLAGSDLVGALAAGVEWWFLPRSGRRWGLGMRVDAVGLRHEVRITVAADRPETHGRFLPGADLVLAGTLQVVSRLDLVLALGSEVAFGDTEIREGSYPMVVATIPAGRAFAQAGLRLGF